MGEQSYYQFGVREGKQNNCGGGMDIYHWYLWRIIEQKFLHLQRMWSCLWVTMSRYVQGQPSKLIFSMANSIKQSPYKILSIIYSDNTYTARICQRIQYQSILRPLLPWHDVTHQSSFESAILLNQSNDNWLLPMMDLLHRAYTFRRSRKSYYAS